MRSMLFYLSGKPMVEPLTGIKILDLSMNVPKLSAFPGSIKSKPATPGSHSQEILKTFGLSAKQFQQLKKAGITE